MHELSIVLGIVDIAEAEVAKAQASRVEEIELDIGACAGIERTALYFAWEAGVRQTVLEHAVLRINDIPARARCAGCGKEFDMENLYDPCPHCGEVFSDLLQGRELRVKSLVVS